MKIFSVLFRKKIFYTVFIIIFVLLGLGAYLTYHYKITIAQSSNPNPSAIPAQDWDRSQRDIIPTKSVEGTDPSTSGKLLAKGEPYKVTLGINGRTDLGTTNGGPADVIIVFDRSGSMGQCGYFRSDGQSCDPITEQGCLTKFDWAKLALYNFLALTGLDPNGEVISDIKLGILAYNTTVPDGKVNVTQISPLRLMNDPSEKQATYADIRDKLKDPGGGTPMSRGVQEANEELSSSQGRPGVAKYIILMTDGVENAGQSLAGNNELYGIWPDSGIPAPNSAAVMSLDKGIQIFTLGFGYPAASFDYLSCDYWAPLLFKTACYSFHINGTPTGDDPPAPVVYTCDYDNLIHEPAEPNNPSPFFKNVSADELNQAFLAIFQIINRRDKGAEITITEMLPPGATLISDPAVGPQPQIDYQLRRSDGVLINRNAEVSVTTIGDNQVITFKILSTAYTPKIPFDDQSFSIELNIKTNNIPDDIIDFDADSNFNCNRGTPFGPNQGNSYVTWSFRFTPAIKAPLPAGCLYFDRNNYSGDIYGTGIDKYAFPGIDVSVAGGRNLSTEAVWSLSSYSFSGSSFSNYQTFRDKLNSKIIPDLLGRAETINNDQELFDKLNNPNPHKDIYPEGMVYHYTPASGVAVIERSLTIGSVANQQQRATIIIDGSLHIRGQTRITKPRNAPSNNVLLIVNGDVTIGDQVQEVDLGILAPTGTIRITNSTNPIRVKGFLIGRDVELRPGSPQSQRINFDPSIALYPPPGLSNIDLPIFKEAKP